MHTQTDTLINDCFDNLLIYGLLVAEPLMSRCIALKHYYFLYFVFHDIFWTKLKKNFELIMIQKYSFSV